MTDAFSDLLIDHLRDHVGGGEEYQPFFAVLSVQPPHGPTVTPTNPPYAARNLSPAQVELRRNVPAVAWVEEQARDLLAGYYGQCLSSAAPEYAGPPRRDAEPASAYLQQIPPRPFEARA